MLPDLSQGVASFADVAVSQADELDAQRLRDFGAAEVLFIYIAFLASHWQRLHRRRDAIQEMLARAEQLAAGPIRWDKRMLGLDADVQALRKDLGTNEMAADEIWQRDQGLVAMYSRADRKPA